MISRQECQPCGQVAEELSGGATAWDRQALGAIAEVAPFLDQVAAAMASVGYARRDIHGMRLALDEAIANAIKHGNGGDPSKKVYIRYRVSAACVLARIEDQGTGFNPCQIPDPTTPENLGRPGGRGVLLMRSYTTWMRYNERGNGITLGKRPSRPLCLSGAEA